MGTAWELSEEQVENALQSRLETVVPGAVGWRRLSVPCGRQPYRSRKKRA